jgi:hypothetical protein
MPAPSGKDEAMLKLTMCATRLPNLTREQFDAHWRERHGPLVRERQEVLGIRRYVQTAPLDNPEAQATLRARRGALPVDFDGCGELWWDSLDDLLAVRKTAEGERALRELLEDEKRFVDLSRSQLWYGTERVIIPG